jgi:hypothetical protein
MNLAVEPAQEHALDVVWRAYGGATASDRPRDLRKIREGVGRAYMQALRKVRAGSS